MAFSIVVPVHNEATRLKETLPALLTGLPAEATAVFVCNGCTDGSADVIRALAGGRVQIIETDVQGKPHAIRLGDRTAGDVLPRFYVDADILISGSSFARLLEELGKDDVELVSPAIDFDTDGCSFAARAIAEVWSELPYMRESGFRTVIGVSREGRRRWPEMPDLIADDTFMAMQIRPERRRIVQSVRAKERVPRTFRSFVGARARWLTGDWELRARGYPPFDLPGKSALLTKLVHPATFLPASIYLTHRILAVIAANWRILRRNKAWYRDETSRRNS